MSTQQPESILGQPPRDADAATARIARLYMSGDLRAATGLSRTHLDFYLREGIVQPSARTESGYLLFDERELELLRRVIAWRQDGTGLREIRERLAEVRATNGRHRTGATD
jgi:MerR family transcriptional regulator, Zn(II)-responsive regulator of zntA